MEQQSYRSVWLPPFEEPTELREGRSPGVWRLSNADLDAAGRLAVLHLEIATELPIDSQIRALTLRSAGHWSRLAGLPRHGLSGVE